MGKYLIFLAPLARVHVCMCAWVYGCRHMSVHAHTHTYAVSQTHTQKQIHTPTQRYYEANPGDLDFLSKSVSKNQN